MFLRYAIVVNHVQSSYRFIGNRDASTPFRIGHSMGCLGKGRRSDTL